MAVNRQESECESRLTAGEITFPNQMPPVLDGHASGEIDSRGRQGFAKGTAI
jgi:hypothetical protein